MTSEALRGPADVDETLVPLRREGLAAHPVGDGVAIYQPLTGGVHRLNATASLVWSLCDGELDAAALIDELAAAFGADRSDVAADVLAVLTDLGQHSLLAGVVSDYEPDPSTVPTADGPAGPVLYPPLSCSPCLARIDGLGWTDPLAVEVGRARVGIRTDAAEARELLERLLGRYLVEDDRVVANYGLRLGTGDDRRVRDLRQLWHGHELVASSSSGADVVAHLLADLAALEPLRSGGPDPLLRLEMCGVLRDGRVTLVPAGWRKHLVALHRRAGSRQVGPPVHLDPATGEVVVPPHGLDVDGPAADELAARYGGATAAAPAPVGRYPIDDLVLVGGGFDDAGVLAHVVQQISNRWRCEPAAVLGGAVGVVGDLGTRWRAVRPGEAEVRAAVRALGR